MAFRLPPLNALRLFEAAGRHLSFRQAAEELNLTPSAVSHGIQSLEDWLGAELFNRQGRGLTLTAAGTQFLPAVRDALATIARGVDRIRGPAQCRLALSIVPTFATRWLLPRLPAFHRRHPEIHLSLDTSTRVTEFPDDRIDLAIRRGDGAWPGALAQHLCGEIIFPVCSPGLVAREDGVCEPADLARATLLHVTSVSEDWAEWLATAGIGGVELSAGLRFDTVQMALDAAVQGLGVALGRRPLVDADIREGRLVKPFGPDMSGRSGYWLVCAPATMRRAEATLFRDWLLDEISPTPETKTEATGKSA